MPSLSEAKTWANWKEARLRAEIQIGERLLRAARTELAEIRNLRESDDDLKNVFAWQSEKDLVEFRKDQGRWKDYMERMFVESELQRLGRRAS